MGNLTRDPELRYTPSGMAVCTLGLAINRKWYDKSTGEKKEDVCFVDVTVWGKTGENCAEYLAKGSQVLIEGRLHFRTWESDGQKRSKLDVVAENVQFMSKRPETDRSEAGKKEAPVEVPGMDEEQIPF